MKTSLLALGAGFAALLAFPSCKKGGGDTTESGIKYEIHGDKKGQKPTESSAVEFHILEKSAKDSVLQTSYGPNSPFGGKPIMIKLDVPQMPKYYKEAIMLLTEGDSGVFEYPADSIFKNPEQEKMRPPFLPKGSMLKFHLKLVNVLDSAEYRSRLKAMRTEQVKGVVAQRQSAIADILKNQADLVKKDQEILDKYVKDQKLENVKKLPSGLMYVIEQEGTGPQVQSGDRVMVNYTGRLLSGKVFDTSVEEEANKAKIAQPGRPYEPFSLVVGSGQVIMGWDEGLPLLKKGSKAKLLIPSYLSYGPQAQGDIPANSPLVFDVEVVDIVAE